MNKTYKVLVAAWFLMMAAAPMVHADEKARASTAAEGLPPTPPPDNSSAELNRIKALAGRWTSTTSMFGTPNQKVFTEYEVTAGGSAVLERIFPGTPQEMISVYYDDDKGHLAMTHYCIMRNRPTLKLASTNGDTIKMDVVKVEGLKAKDDPSMGNMTLTLKDKDHFTSTCSGRGKGSEKEEPHTMEFTRVK
jgi:hypothetical protein